MERNYFLSYGHKIVLILLLSAVGTLNKKLISVAKGYTELPLYTDVNVILPQSSADISLQQSSKNLNTLTSNNGECSRHGYGFYTGIIKKHFSPAKGDDFFMSLLKDLNFMPVWYQWTPIYSIDNKNTLKFGQTRKIYASSAKLVDGFKFIIKIPDKLTAL